LIVGLPHVQRSSSLLRRPVPFGVRAFPPLFFPVDLRSGGSDKDALSCSERSAQTPPAPPLLRSMLTGRSCRRSTPPSPFRPARRQHENSYLLPWSFMQKGITAPSHPIACFPASLAFPAFPCFSSRASPALCKESSMALCVEIYRKQSASA